MQSVFHLAYHVTDLDAARRFYGDTLGCREGRSTDTWVDFDFFGHQISLHLGQPFAVSNTGQVGQHMVPMPHLGIILLKPDWLALAERLKARLEVAVGAAKRHLGSWLGERFRSS